MKKLKLFSSLLLFGLTSQSLFSATCPEKISAPLCPTSGSTLLDETYPTQAFVISNRPFNPTKEARNVTREFVSKIIANYDYDKIPQILLPMENKSEFNSLVATIKNQLKQKKIPNEKINEIVGQMAYVEAPNYTWQQDWFESFVDLKTGSPLVRQIDSYDRVSTDKGYALAKAGEKCNIQLGQNITEDFGNPTSTEDMFAQELSFDGGEMGGNIEGAPGGFCMVGDNQGKKFTAQFCGDESNVIKLQTSWLTVGHVDEIFKIIPTQYNDGRPKECQFSLMAASPKKALSLMSHSQKGRIPFFDIDSKNPDRDEAEFRRSRSSTQYPGNYKICSYIHNILKSRGSDKKAIPSAVKSVFLKLFLGPEALASSSLDLVPDEVLRENCSKNLDQVSNYEIQKMITLDKDLMKYNEAINNSIEKDKELIKKKILSRLPQCEKYYDELDVPNLFYGGQTYLDPKTKKVELIKPGDGNSFLPNPTNSVLMNKTVVFPDTGNYLFNSYLNEEMTKRKMKTDFIASWDYAHLGNGNIHCASHSLPYCQPSNTKGK